MRRVVRGLWPLPVLAAVGMVLIAGTFWAAQPPTGGLSKEQEKQIYEALRDVTNQGAKLFNEQGDYAGCFRLYEGALKATRPFLGSQPELQKAIDGSLAEAKANPSVVQKAFTLRKAIDQIRDKFKPGGAVQPPPPEDKDKSFTLSASGVVKIKQGDKKDVLVTVTRGKDFKGDIKVDGKASPGLKVVDVKEADNGLKVSIAVAKDAPLGNAEVALTGTGGGKTATATIKVEVEKAGAKPPDDPTSFKIVAPGMLKLKAGDKYELIVVINRGKEFKGKVEATLKAGKGVTVTPDKGEVPETEKVLKVSVAVDKDAPAGKVDININASGGGKTAKKKIVVNIEKAGEPPPPDKDVSFKFSAAAVKLKPGEKKDVTLTVTRGKDLKDQIKVEPKLTQGLLINPKKPLLGEKDTTFQVTIEAFKTTAPGKLKAIVIGSVGKNAVEAIIDVEIEKAGDTPPPPDGKDKDFKLAGPPALKLKQGEKKDVEIKVTRGKDLKDKITVELKLGKGLNAKPLKTELDATSAGFVVTLGADKDAIPGKSEIEITATGGGKTHKATIPVEIEKAGDKPPPPPVDKKATVSGKVTLDGKPVPIGEVVFLHSDIKFAQIFPAPLKSDGSYEITTASFSPDTYIITYQAPKKVLPDQPNPKIPAKYSNRETSGLTVTIKPGTQTFNIELKSEKKPDNPPPLPGKSTLSGKVTLDGKPLPGGSVGFVPTDLNAAIKLHLSLIKPDGTYAFADGELPPGTYKIGVGGPDKLPPGAAKFEIPKQYQAAINSPLMYTVKTGVQTFDIILQSDKKTDIKPPDKK